MIKHISVQELKIKLKEKDVTLIDVREPEEYMEMNIQGSHLIPLRDISLDTLPQNTSCIVIQCRSGKRSSAACEKLLMENPDLTLYSLDGGILAWKEIGYPVEEPKNSLFT